MVHFCNPSYVEGRCRRIVFGDQPLAKAWDPGLKNSQYTKGWGQVQDPHYTVPQERSHNRS
jgi:hypothetical protein